MEKTKIVEYSIAMMISSFFAILIVMLLAPIIIFASLDAFQAQFRDITIVCRSEYFMGASQIVFKDEILYCSFNPSRATMDAINEQIKVDINSEG